MCSYENRASRPINWDLSLGNRDLGRLGSYEHSIDWDENISTVHDWIDMNASFRMLQMPCFLWEFHVWNGYVRKENQRIEWVHVHVCANRKTWRYLKPRSLTNHLLWGCHAILAPLLCPLIPNLHSYWSNCLCTLLDFSYFFWLTGLCSLMPGWPLVGWALWKWQKMVRWIEWVHTHRCNNRKKRTARGTRKNVFNNGKIIWMCRDLKQWSFTNRSFQAFCLANLAPYLHSQVPLQ